MKNIQAYLILFSALLIISCDKRANIPSEIIGNWQMIEQVKVYTDYDKVEAYPMCSDSPVTGTRRCEDEFWNFKKNGSIDRFSRISIDGDVGETVELEKYFYSFQDDVIDINAFAYGIDGTVEFISNRMTISGELFNQGLTIPSDITFRRVD